MVDKLSKNPWDQGQTAVGLLRTRLDFGKLTVNLVLLGGGGSSFKGTLNKRHRKYRVLHDLKGGGTIGSHWAALQIWAADWVGECVHDMWPSSQA